MLAIHGPERCHRCGGDMLEELSIDKHDDYLSHLSCLQCGELRFRELPPLTLDPNQLRGRPGRPRKLAIEGPDRTGRR